MVLSLLGKDLYPGWEEGWPLCFRPGKFGRILDRKTGVKNLGPREAGKAQVVSPASCSCKRRGGAKAPRPIPRPNPKGPGGRSSDLRRQEVRERRREAQVAKRELGRRSGKRRDGGGKEIDRPH